MGLSLFKAWRVAGKSRGGAKTPAGAAGTMAEPSLGREKERHNFHPSLSADWSASGTTSVPERTDWGRGKFRYSLLPPWSLIFLASSSDVVCAETFTSGTATREQYEGMSLMRTRGSDQHHDLPPSAAVKCVLKQSACAGLPPIKHLLLDQRLMD